MKTRPPAPIPPSLSLGIHLQSETHQLLSLPASKWTPEDLARSAALLERAKEHAPIKLMARHHEAAELQLAGERGGYPPPPLRCDADLRTIVRVACERIERNLRRAGGGR